MCAGVRTLDWVSRVSGFVSWVTNRVSVRPPSRRTMLRIAGYVAGWALIAIPASYHFFINDSRDTVIAGHDATVQPTHDGYATVDLGAYLPNVRYPTDHVLGVHIVVGKTNLDTYQGLLQRYALIGSHPEGEIDKVVRLVQAMLLVAIAKGALVGLIGPFAWRLVGHRRRKELLQRVTPQRIGIAAVAVAVAVLVSTSAPLIDHSDTTAPDPTTWEPIATFLPEAQIPSAADRLQIQGGLVTSGTQSLIASAFDSYKTSKEYYEDLSTRAPALASQLRQAKSDETVVLLISDRHDNVGMDPVAKAIGDAAGATVVFDSGDDTSTGEKWETFSLDSLVSSFKDYDERYAVSGNHDEGDFVGAYLADNGWTDLSGEPLTTDAGIRLLGVADPRSSGLGNWRTEVGISFDDQANKLADTACKANADGHRVSTLLVHDANLGDPALERGCVDLVLAGHLHTQVGPDAVRAANGAVGYSYTTGSTGGAAYAMALGTKLKRDAEVTIVTYQDGIPVGLQPVWIGTNSVFRVEPFIPLRIVQPTESSDAAP